MAKPNSPIWAVKPISKRPIWAVKSENKHALMGSKRTRFGVDMKTKRLFLVVSVAAGGGSGGGKRRGCGGGGCYGDGSRGGYGAKVEEVTSW
ncbi:hypothetical protein Tco_0580736 [Tanacetum coccineum]